MQLEEITFALFAACNSIRIFAYAPQIYKAAIDRNGALAISRTTWLLFLVANLSTSAYALVNRSDLWLALCFAGNALCCLAILAIALWKARGHKHSASASHSERSVNLFRRRSSGFHRPSGSSRVRLSLP